MNFFDAIGSFERARRFNWTLIYLFSVSWQAFWVLWFWGTFWFSYICDLLGYGFWVRAELSLLTGPWHWTWKGLEIGSLMLVDNSTLSGVCKEPSDHQNTSFAFCCCLWSVATQESINFSICGWRRGVKVTRLVLGHFYLAQCCHPIAMTSCPIVPNFICLCTFITGPQIVSPCPEKQGPSTVSW